MVETKVTCFAISLRLLVIIYNRIDWLHIQLLPVIDWSGKRLKPLQLRAIQQTSRSRIESSPVSGHGLGVERDISHSHTIMSWNCYEYEKDIIEKANRGKKSKPQIVAIDHRDGSAWPFVLLLCGVFCQVSNYRQIPFGTGAFESCLLVSNNRENSLRHGFS